VPGVGPGTKDVTGEPGVVVTTTYGGPPFDGVTVVVPAVGPGTKDVAGGGLVPVG